jgi:hypothetical protein
MKSEFILGDVLNKLQYFQPTKIYIDDKLIWDDDKDINDGWISYDVALSKYAKDLWISSVRRVDIKVIDFHHSIVDIFTTRG